MAEFDWRAWTPRLAKFYDALLRSQSGATHLHDLRKALRYGLTADLASFAQGDEEIFEAAQLCLKLEVNSSSEAEDAELELAGLEEEEAAGDEQDSTGQGEQLEGPDPQAAATLRRIARKQRNDPHNRETLLGFPLIGARMGRRLITGPLLVWEMDIDYDPRSREVRLRRRNSTPDLNTILLGKLADDPDDISLANEKLLPLLYDDGFGPARIPELIQVLTGIFEPLAQCEEIAALDCSLKEFLQQLGSLKDPNPALITMRPVLANGPRSYAFLLSDLRAIGAQSNPGGDSVLAQIVEAVPTVVEGS